MTTKENNLNLNLIQESQKGKERDSLEKWRSWALNFAHRTR